MRKIFTEKFPLIIVVLLSVTFLTGCTFFDKAKEAVIGNEQENAEVTEIVSQSVTIEVTDQNGETISVQTDFADEENLYEVLNKAIFENDTLSMEFETFELNGEPSFFITTINGYNPQGDNKFWMFKVNGELSNVGISEYKPNADDLISFELDTIR